LPSPEASQPQAEMRSHRFSHRQHIRAAMPFSVVPGGGPAKPFPP
jgi:hypothetical protein